MVTLIRTVPELIQVVLKVTWIKVHLEYLLLGVGSRGQNVLSGDQSTRSHAGGSGSLAGAQQKMSVIISAVQGSVASINNTTTDCGTGTGNGQACDQQ